MRRKKDRSNSSKVLQMVSHRMIVKTRVNLHRAEAALAMALTVRLPERR